MKCTYLPLPEPDYQSLYFNAEDGTQAVTTGYLTSWKLTGSMINTQLPTLSFQYQTRVATLLPLNTTESDQFNLLVSNNIINIGYFTYGQVFEIESFDGLARESLKQVQTRTILAAGATPSFKQIHDSTPTDMIAKAKAMLRNQSIDMLGIPLPSQLVNNIDYKLFTTDLVDNYVMLGQPGNSARQWFFAFLPFSLPLWISLILALILVILTQVLIGVLDHLYWCWSMKERSKATSQFNLDEINESMSQRVAQMLYRTLGNLIFTKSKLIRTTQLTYTHRWLHFILWVFAYFTAIIYAVQAFNLCLFTNLRVDGDRMAYPFSDFASFLREVDALGPAHPYRWRFLADSPGLALVQAGYGSASLLSLYHRANASWPDDFIIPSRANALSFLAQSPNHFVISGKFEANALVIGNCQITVVASSDEFFSYSFAFKPNFNGLVYNAILDQFSQAKSNGIFSDLQESLNTNICDVMENKKQILTGQLTVKDMTGLGIIFVLGAITIMILAIVDQILYKRRLQKYRHDVSLSNDLYCVSA
ncbi:hypothetical protein Ciccas_005540 [Cichlidogyrus casuarinus]|uniref:Uncharacterized protein n=1 Tax=Cichlidogyrus casuarinus TaxID=1844966 RepID=A0ABD2Q8C6_9PLAT